MISFSRATWRMRYFLVEGLPGDISSTKEMCSRRSSLLGVERRDVGSESTRGRFLAGVMFADGFAKGTGSIVRGFKRGSNDAWVYNSPPRTLNIVRQFSLNM